MKYLPLCDAQQCTGSSLQTSSFRFNAHHLCMWADMWELGSSLWRLLDIFEMERSLFGQTEVFKCPKMLNSCQIPSLKKVWRSYSCEEKFWKKNKKRWKRFMVVNQLGDSVLFYGEVFVYSQEPCP